MSEHNNNNEEVKHDDHHSELGHIVDVKVYLKVFLALLVLTVITIAIAQVDFGNQNLNLVIAMLIASVKAGFVALFFMHLKYENPITWMYVLFPIFLLFMLLGGVFIDNPYR